MSDMKKLLDSLTEMATVSGSVATVSAPLGATRTRAKGTPSVYGEQVSETESVEKTDECDAESDREDDVTNNVKTPANFGLWQNSYHQAEEQKKQSKTKKSGDKKSVSEARVSDEMSELDRPEIQSAMKRMKAKYDSDPRTQDQEKFSRDLGRRLQAAAARSEKKSRPDEQLNDNRGPGGLRPLNLAEQNLDEADLIMNPFERSKKRPRDIFSKTIKQDHEVSMARSDLLQCIKNSERVIELLSSMSDRDNIEAWVQEKIVKANDYLNTITEYLEGKTALGEGEDLAWDDPDLVTMRKMQAAKKKKMAVVKPKDEIGFKVADIGPGGREHNVKTDATWDKKNPTNEQAVGEKNSFNNPLGKALYRDLGKEKKASPAQVQLNKERWAKRQAERGQGVAEGKTPSAWVDLTDDQIEYIWGISPGDYEDKFAFPRAIESALKSKNTSGNWVDLTDDQIEYIWGISPGDYEDKFAFPRAIESALKSKNTSGVAEAYDDSMTDAEWEREYQREKSEKEQARKEIEKNHVSQFKTKDDAVKYANDRLKTFKDSKIGMSVYSMSDGGFDVVSTARNAAGEKRRKLISDAGGKHLGTLGPRYTKHKMAEGGKSPSPGWMLRQDPELAKKVKDAKAGYQDLKKYAGKDIPKKEVKEQNWSRDPWKEKEFGPTTVIKKIFKIKIQDSESNVKAFNVKAETEQQAREVIEKHVPGAEILDVKFVKNLMVSEAPGENLPPLKSPKKDDPYEQGWRTFYRRGDESDNPYERGTPEYQQWNRGFQDGEAEPNHYDESVNVSEKGPGLWANIHAKRERIKKGSGERMRKPGSKGAPNAKDLKAAQTPKDGDKKS